MSDRPASAAPLSYVPGITLRSLAAAAFGLLLMGMLVQIMEVVLTSQGAPAEHSLAIPTMAVFMLLLLTAGMVKLLTNYRLLTRAELLCVLMAMVLATPMMTQGMWHRFVGLIAATPRTQSFAYIDAYNDKLWPHGQNLIPGAFSEAGRSALQLSGAPPSWEEVAYEAGKKDQLLVLEGKTAEAAAAVSLTLPVVHGGTGLIVPGEPYLLTLLVRADKLSPDASFTCRVYADDHSDYREVLAFREPPKPTFLHQTGFARIGVYGYDLGGDAQQAVKLEFALHGEGHIALYDPKLFSVSALEWVYRGRKMVHERDWAALPPAQRVGVVIKPDQMWSWAGLKFLFTGYIPVRAWLTPALAWGVPILLLLTGILAMNVFMRRQWAESERYPFPLFQIPYALLGEADEPAEPAFAQVWRNPALWAGVVVSLTYCLLIARFTDTSTPPSLALNSFPALNDARFGGMWNLVFQPRIYLVAILLFFEINVLVSLLLGFLFCQAQSWMGEFTGMKRLAGFPFKFEQAIGAYLGYAAVVVFFSRRYLLQGLQAALRGTPKGAGEAFSYRTAVLLFLATFVGLVLWAKWMALAVVPMVLFFAFLLLLGFVASKFRAECGLPTAYFTPYNSMLFVSFIAVLAHSTGGMALFGPSAMMFCLIASGFLTVSVFFLGAGAQLELLEFGRRYRIQPRHLVYTCLIGALAGLFIGGYVFLSNAYSLGGSNIRYTWSFNQNWFFGTYSGQLQSATTDFLRASGQAAAPPGAPVAGGLSGWLASVTPSTWGYWFGAVITIILAALRQIFAGFWFHPIGFVLSSAFMMTMQHVWGSCLVAVVLRWTVLKLGGAATVKQKLMPFAVGLLLGSLLAMMILFVIACVLRANGHETKLGDVL